jgi:hypothetical protein
VSTHKVGDLRSKLESLLRSSSEPRQVYRWRADLDRYESICHALIEDFAGGELPEITRIHPHPDPEIAAACHRRRAEKKLAFQQGLARSEFVHGSIELCRPELRGELRRLLRTLAVHLNDPGLDREINEAFQTQQKHPPAGVKHSEAELWQSRI